MWTHITNGELPTPQLGSARDIKRIAVIFNTGKDRKKIETYVKLIKKRAPTVEIDLIVTQNLAEGLEQAKQAQENGYDLLVAAGGDGTLLSVLNALVNTQTLLSILPLGSANDYSRAIGIKGLEEAVEAVCQGVVRQADVGRCTYQDFDQQVQQTYFCSTAGVGLFGEISRLEEYPLSVWLKKVLKDAVWPLLAAAAIFSNQNVPTTLRLNEHQLKINMRMLEVSKVQNVAGFLLAPLASLNNEVLDSWMIHDLNSVQIWRAFFKAISSKAAHLHQTNVEYFTSAPKWNRYGYTKLTRIDVHPSQPLPVHLNGDFIGLSPAIFEVLPNALKVLAPK